MDVSGVDAHPVSVRDGSLLWIRRAARAYRRHDPFQPTRPHWRQQNSPTATHFPTPRPDARSSVAYWIDPACVIGESIPTRPPSHAARSRACENNDVNSRSCAFQSGRVGNDEKIVVRSLSAGALRTGGGVEQQWNVPAGGGRGDCPLACVEGEVVVAHRHDPPAARIRLGVGGTGRL